MSELKGKIINKNTCPPSCAVGTPSGMVDEKYVGLYSVLIILFLYLIATLLTGLAAAATDSTFVLWFRDTPLLLLAVLIYMGLLGIVWDGSLIAAGLIFQIVRSLRPSGKSIPITVESTRKIRFFTCGISPLIIILLTAFVILGTSNITLISLNLLGTVTEWRDPFLWNLEGSIFEWLTRLPIDAASWDKLYHGAWGIELFAAFVLILISRGPKIVLSYGISMILLFYAGRFLGLLNPVMGPVFFKPELFAYLGGSITDAAMKSIAAILSMSSEEARNSGGILLGGVSAMPSLHVGMVTLAAYWLAFAKRWTMFVTAPWVLLVWTSTVVLGWHYILDGLGGIALGAACIWATHWSLGQLRDNVHIV